MLRITFALLLLMTSLAAAPPPAQILYKMRGGALEEAVAAYKSYKAKKGSHDLLLLRQMALAIITDSSHRAGREIQLLSLWAAAFSLNPEMLPILNQGLKNEDPRDILATLFFLMNFPDDRALALVKEELQSPWLPIQATAAEFLIQKGEKGILEIVARWLDRVDPRAYPLFVPLFAPSEERFATCWMKKFLHSSNPDVRLMALLEAGKRGRDDLLNEIREAAKTGNVQDQEAAAFALGILGDSSSITLLKDLAQTGAPATRLSAAYSLVRLGQTKYSLLIGAAAKEGNLFAIHLLGTLKMESDLLADLQKSADLDIRANSTIALLLAKDERALEGLKELLNPRLKNLVLVATTSPGHALEAFQLKPLVTIKDLPCVTLSRRQLIEEASLLAHEPFLTFAREVIVVEDKETVPALIWAVKDIDISFLEEQLKRPGSPLARSWATLALYTRKEKGPYKETVHHWFVQMKNLAIIAVTPPSLETSYSSFHQMTRRESCELLMASLDAIASSRDQEAIDSLLEALVKGNPLNRPVIASLLLRLSE